MRIAITGATSGIGLSIRDRFAANGEEITCFSRTNGYDLSKKDTIDRIAAAADDFDVMINNAFHGFAQVSLLYAIHGKWQGRQDKYHVVISSMSPDWGYDEPNLYTIQKAALDKATLQLSEIATYRLTNIRPAWVDTPRVAFNTDANKMSPSDLADLVHRIVMDDKLHIASISVRGV